MWLLTERRLSGILPVVAFILDVDALLLCDGRTTFIVPVAQPGAGGVRSNDLSQRQIP